MSRSRSSRSSRSESADTRSLREVTEEELAQMDPKEAKKMRRLIRNRLSAHMHRERQRQFLEDTQRHTAALTAERDALRALVERVVAHAPSVLAGSVIPSIAESVAPAAQPPSSSRSKESAAMDMDSLYAQYFETLHASGRIVPGIAPPPAKRRAKSGVDSPVKASSAAVPLDHSQIAGDASNDASESTPISDDAETPGLVTRARAQQQKHQQRKSKRAAGDEEKAESPIDLIPETKQPQSLFNQPIVAEHDDEVDDLLAHGHIMPPAVTIPDLLAPIDDQAFHENLYDSPIPEDEDHIHHPPFGVDQFAIPVAAGTKRYRFDI